MRVCLAMVLFGASMAPLAAIASDDDEAWIESYMSQPGRSAGPAQVRRGYVVAWRDLGRFLETPVKVTTQAGVVHRGYIEQAGAAQIILRSQLYGGYAQLKLGSAQVRTIELE